MNNEFSVPELDQVENLRSIGSTSMNQGNVKANLNSINQGGSSLLKNPKNQYLYMNHQYSRQANHSGNAIEPQVTRKNLTQSRGNPFQPASPATSGTIKM